ncbi:MAG: hypothetical protein BAJALOKI2v1_390001 [Promethearchaeota archaeon]|nr:MAG: hypothetical protein BAJALOKI2v1_390001 [Candidatus Lokiarchaeota archaeon]
MLREHLDLEDDKDITLYTIWKHRFKVGGINYDLDLKLALLNGKIEQFVKDKKEKGINTAYQNLLKGTQLHEDYKSSKKKYVDKMLRILSTLIREGYIGRYNLEKMIDYYSWTKVKTMWNLDVEYPEFTHDLWIFDIGFP